MTEKEIESTERKPGSEIENRDLILMNEVVKCLVDAGFSAYLQGKELTIHSRLLSVKMNITKFIDWH